MNRLVVDLRHRPQKKSLRAILKLIDRSESDSKLGSPLTDVVYVWTTCRRRCCFHAGTCACATPVPTRRGHMRPRTSVVPFVVNLLWRQKSCRACEKRRASSLWFDTAACAEENGAGTDARARRSFPARASRERARDNEESTPCRARSLHSVRSCGCMCCAG